VLATWYICFSMMREKYKLKAHYYSVRMQKSHQQCVTEERAQEQMFQ